MDSNQIKKIFTSKIFLIVIAAYSAFAIFQNRRWQTLSIIHDDAINYYAYLPATFIYHDLTFNFMDTLPPNSGVKIYKTKGPDGRVVLKMTIGESLMILPFFLSAHIYSILNLFPTTGYTDIYEFSIAAAALFYFALGLFFLRKSLKKKFSDWVVLVVLLIIGLATNLFFYVTYESGMSHAYSFCLFSVFLWLTLQWHENPTVKLSILTGLILGIITLIRPTNGLVFIFFIFYGVTNRTSFWDKLIFLKSNIIRVFVFGISVFLPLSLQLMYWKFASGHWMYYSYGEERFYFNHPHIWEGLFGFRKGFFVYTPVMIFIIAGIWMAFRKGEKYAAALVVFFLVNIYVMFSWWCWWYGGGFGCRPMIESYALLALPLGTFINKCFSSNWLVKIISVIFIFLFIKLNLFQIDQVKSTVLHWDSMNARTYFKIFGRKGFPENYNIMLTATDADNAFKGLPERDVFDLTANSLTLKYSYKIFIKGRNSKFVCDDLSKYGVILCNRDNPYNWETFQLNKYAGNYCTLQTFEKKYAGIDFSRESKLFASKTVAEKTEVFKMIDLYDNKFALKACDGSYITCNNKDSTLSAGASKITQAETFELISR